MQNPLINFILFISFIYNKLVHIKLDETVTLLNTSSEVHIKTRAKEDDELISSSFF